MLQQLDIQNYAIIDQLNIRFTGQLNVITGETGAGKSILMGALSLVLGDRADSALLLDKQKKCFVEAHFTNENAVAEKFLQSNDFDVDAAIIIRREILPNGKSRAFINDTPATLLQLRELTSLLVDLHRQFDTQELNTKDFQLEVLDALAGHDDLLKKYQQRFAEYREIKNELEKLKEEQLQAGKESDYNQFLFDELEKANFKENEIEGLETESQMMAHAENIKSALEAVIYFLNEGEEPVLNQLKIQVSKLSSVSKLVPSLSAIEERLQSSWIELKDIASELEQVNEEVSFSQERMEEINSRLDVAYTLFKKHQVQSVNDLLLIKEELGRKLNAVSDLSEEIEKLTKRKENLFEELIAMAEKISEKRNSQIIPFAKKVNKLLGLVGMPNAALKVEFNKLKHPCETGVDEVAFLFNANKTTFQPIRKVASGGELSRLMLIIKSLIAQSVNLPTLIFDEIDTGISGEASRQVANIIKELSAAHQVILITHQPQIAAKAHTHFYVFKEIKNGKVTTAIKRLNEQEHIHAIATMISGENPTAAAFENAKELMN